MRQFIKSKLSTKNKIKKSNKQINILINYLERVYKIMYLIKMIMNLHVIFLTNTWKKQKMNVFQDLNITLKLKFFSGKKLNFNLEPGTKNCPFEFELTVLFCFLKHVYCSVFQRDKNKNCTACNIGSDKDNYK